MLSWGAMTTRGLRPRKFCGLALITHSLRGNRSIQRRILLSKALARRPAQGGAEVTPSNSPGCIASAALFAGGSRAEFQALHERLAFALNRFQYVPRGSRKEAAPCISQYVACIDEVLGRIGIRAQTTVDRRVQRGPARQPGVDARRIDRSFEPGLISDAFSRRNHVRPGVERDDTPTPIPHRLAVNVHRVSRHLEVVR